jgi:hypothetical protein
MSEISLPKEMERRFNLPRLAGVVCLILLAAAVTWGFLLMRPQGLRPDQMSQGIVNEQQAIFEEKSGVRIVRLAITSGGGMIDLRYLVIDPDKALVIHDRDNPPTVVDESTGQSYNTPWMDHGHTRALKAGVVYYTLLLNQGGGIRRGDWVTVIIGGYRLEHVIVQ